MKELPSRNYLSLLEHPATRAELFEDDVGTERETYSYGISFAYPDSEVEVGEGQAETDPRIATAGAFARVSNCAERARLGRLRGKEYRPRNQEVLCRALTPLVLCSQSPVCRD